ncbi:MAG: hypothetical protein ACI8TP_002760 [Acidimicrobiales bacterium]|jgi:hypothetical protein
MKKLLTGLVLGVLMAGGAAIWSGALSFGWPWHVLPEFSNVEVVISLPEEARIVAVEPIALDCRARVHAVVPVEGQREHRLFGRVYRTDTVELEAVGDVDTCVEGTSATVIHKLDGTTEVVIPGDAILFVRPRVDAVATASSVHVDKGLVGKATDVFPWVSDDLGLTPLAYAYAQNVIGGSECMETAYTVTESMLIEAYRQQYIDQGADPDDLTIRIDGRPTFPDPNPVDLGDDLTMSVGDDHISCVLSDELGGGNSDERP